MRSKSPALQEAEAKAKEIEDSLGAYDFKPCNYVHIVSEEGTEWFLASAFVLEYKDWYLVFSEHNDPVVVHKEDTVSIDTYEAVSTYIIPVDKFKPKPKRPRMHKRKH